MKVPQLKKKLEIKTCHNIDWEDNYSWIHQDNILEVLKDPKKILPEVKKYIDDNNLLTENYFDDIKNLKQSLFKEIKSKIKLSEYN